MTNTITFLIAMLITINSFGQSFEGKIVYSNKYHSKIPNLTDQQFTSMMGSTQEYFIKGGTYKSINNGSYFQWQLYVNIENKHYSKVSNSETLSWIDGTKNKDEILKVETNKGVIEILGYKCDEIIFTCKSGTQKYYFNAKLSVDPKLYINHKFGNWYDYLLKTNALPLKMIVSTAEMDEESVATDVKKMKLTDSLFDLPVNVVTKKSAY